MKGVCRMENNNVLEWDIEIMVWKKQEQSYENMVDKREILKKYSLETEVKSFLFIWT